jgi:hypothetical protein
MIFDEVWLESGTPARYPAKPTIFTASHGYGRIAKKHRINRL